MADLDNNDTNFPSQTAGTKGKADEMESDGHEQEHRSAKLVEIIPNGDILFQVGCGNDALGIKVSGLVVSLASEVFARIDIPPQRAEMRLCIPALKPWTVTNISSAIEEIDG
ncbi:hypothetical protein AYL99_02370 [Fonsecaea erecta]|uniref:Uncharacterized protein n=1 Tax=Fonsecaea erecta TaxID=1367422 RepID=A0A178ZV70_9EURO|nr:hypothetical protein AYL99_02370 [Fonsecaea erecta]OAP63143.1 hypothetical protein AYL99_02370 [Fonsecaea erecta]